MAEQIPRRGVDEDAADMIEVSIFDKDAEDPGSAPNWDERHRRDFARRHERGSLCRRGTGRSWHHRPRAGSVKWRNGRRLVVGAVDNA